jgi:hypothetical protein
VENGFGKVEWLKYLDKMIQARAFRLAYEAMGKE